MQAFPLQRFRCGLEEAEFERRTGLGAAPHCEKDRHPEEFQGREREWAPEGAESRRQVRGHRRHGQGPGGYHAERGGAEGETLIRGKARPRLR